MIEIEFLVNGVIKATTGAKEPPEPTYLRNDFRTEKIDWEQLPSQKAVNDRWNRGQPMPE